MICLHRECSGKYSYNLWWHDFKAPDKQPSDTQPLKCDRNYRKVICYTFSNKKFMPWKLRKMSNQTDSSVDSCESTHVNVFISSHSVWWENVPASGTLCKMRWTKKSIMKYQSNVYHGGICPMEEYALHYSAYVYI